MPAVVDAVLSRGELLTAYTPYQPEMSQGVLQAIFEYQTAICELTGLDVSNASGYDGTTVAADACYIAKHATGRSRVVVAETVNPQVRQVVKTYAPGFGLEVVEVPHRDGVTDATEFGDGRRGRGLRDLPAAELLRLPRAGAGPRRRGGTTPARSRSRTSTRSRSACSRRRATTAARSPSARASRRGNYQSYGGPHYGFLAARSDLHPAHAGPDRRRDGRHRRASAAIVLTLQTREQHIRREKATSNITTNQTLLALAGLVYLVVARARRGCASWGRPASRLAEYAKQALLGPVPSSRFRDRQHSRSLPSASDGPRARRSAARREHGVHPGYALGRDYDGLDDALLVCVTEKRTRERHRPAGGGGLAAWS